MWRFPAAEIELLKYFEEKNQFFGLKNILIAEKILHKVSNRW